MKTERSRVMLSGKLKVSIILLTLLASVPVVYYSMERNDSTQVAQISEDNVTANATIPTANATIPTANATIPTTNAIAPTNATSPNVTKTQPLSIETNIMFHVLHEDFNFTLRQCLEDISVEYMVATYKEGNKFDLDVSRLSYAESRNRLLLKSLAMGNNPMYYCFIDGDLTMDCTGLTNFLKKLMRSGLSVVHPYYEYWQLTKCGCDFCGYTFSDSSFLCFHRDSIRHYFPLNPYCDKHAWTVHVGFLLQDIFRQQEFFYVDTETRYNNPRHEKSYLDYNLDCMKEYYDKNLISYNKSLLVVPWNARFAQSVVCRNVTAAQ